MEKSLRVLCQLVLELASAQEAFSANRLSPAEVQTLFTLVDVKQKGYLDLKDIHDLIGKTSEEEMFAVFKFLDTTRSGEIGVSQLTTALADPSLTSNNTSKDYIFPRFYAQVDAVKDRPQILTKLKRKYCLSEQQLTAIYDHACGLMGTKYLLVTDLAAVLKAQTVRWGLKWLANVEKVLTEQLGQNVSPHKLVSTFGKEGAQKNEGKGQVREASPISRWEDSPQAVQATGNRYQQAIEEKNASILSKKTSSYVPPRQPCRQVYREPYRQPQPHRQSELIRCEDPTQHLDTPSFKNIATIEPPHMDRMDRLDSCVDDVLNSIQQRRERLRQDSQERKKLIQEVMQRKKQSCGLNIAEDWEGREWEGRDQFSRSSANTLTKKAAPYKSYIQPSPTQSPSSTMDKFYNRDDKLTPPQSPGELRDYLPHKLQKNSSQPRLQLQIDSRCLVADRNSNTNAYAYDVNDLLRKYSGDWQAKQLSKSKSGCFVQNYMGESKPQEEKQFKREWGNSHSKLSNASMSAKENVMRRAEEEAARKIEEIERKARMKVLQRKNQAGRAQREQEWGRSRPLY